MVVSSRGQTTAISSETRQAKEGPPQQDEELYGKDFFDAGRKEPGVFECYSWEHFYPESKELATRVKGQFNPAKVLDLGCAKGFLVYAFAEMGIDAYGVDTSDYAISSAPLEIRPYLYQVDLNKDTLPFEAEKFDFVTFLGTIEYLYDPKLAIQEVSRILRHGGRLYLTTIYERDPEDKIRINIHSKAFWIREFQSNGFKFMPGELATLEKAHLRYIFRIPREKSTIKFKLAKLVYGKGGYVGKEIAFWGSKSAKNYGTLLFMKESKFF